MATQNKTVGKTTTTNPKKGEYKMDAIKKQQMYYNNRQEYNQENGKTYHYMTTEHTEKLRAHLTKQQLDKLTEAWTIIEDYNTMIFRSLDKQYRLNNIYGKEQIHYSELSQEELDLIKQHRAKQEEFKEHKQQDNKAKRTATKAVESK